MWCAYNVMYQALLEEESRMRFSEIWSWIDCIVRSEYIIAFWEDLKKNPIFKDACMILVAPS